MLKIRGRSKAELTLASLLGSVVAKGLNSLYFSRLYCSIAYDLVHADTEMKTLEVARTKFSFLAKS